MRPRRLAALLAALVAAGPVVAADLQNDRAVKAAFVFNFAKFTQWPDSAFADARAPLAVCLLGDRSRHGAAFAAVDGKTAQGRTVQMRYGVRGDDLPACQVLYLQAQDAAQWPEVQRLVASAPVLTIGDVEDFASAGGIIGLVTTADGRVAFQVNPDAARQAGLKLSSQLMVLARIVKSDKGRE